MHSAILATAFCVGAATTDLRVQKRTLLLQANRMLCVLVICYRVSCIITAACLLKDKIISISISSTTSRFIHVTVMVMYTHIYWSVISLHKTSLGGSYMLHSVWVCNTSRKHCLTISWVPQVDKLNSANFNFYTFCLPNIITGTVFHLQYSAVRQTLGF